jgi:hypothetical protein
MMRIITTLSTTKFGKIYLCCSSVNTAKFGQMVMDLIL